MKLSVAAKSSLTLIVVMFGLLIALGAVAGANLGAVELTIWLAILVFGLALIGFGARRSGTLDK